MFCASRARYAGDPGVGAPELVAAPAATGTVRVAATERTAASRKTERCSTPVGFGAQLAVPASGRVSCVAGEAFERGRERLDRVLLHRQGRQQAQDFGRFEF